MEACLTHPNHLFQKNDGLDLLALHEFAVRVSVFLQGSGDAGVLEAEDADTFITSAVKLADQGLLVTAAKYCRYGILSLPIFLMRLLLIRLF